MGHAVKSRTAKGRLPGCLHRWQRLLLGVYVMLFALVLPFICWGAVAEPGHPHRLPHFVFATPVLAANVAQIADEYTPTTRTMLDEASHGAGHAVAVRNENTRSAQNPSTDSPIPGRSTPKLMIFAILLLLLLGADAVKRFDLHHFAMALRHHFPKSILLPVPIQPPRPILL